MSRIFIVLAFVSAVGCAAKLQPHVWLPLKGVDSVDFFWWTESQVCNLRVLWLEPNGTYKGYPVIECKAGLPSTPLPTPSPSPTPTATPSPTVSPTPTSSGPAES